MTTQVADLTTAQQTTLVATDFASLLERIYHALGKVHPANDADAVEVASLRSTLVLLKPIIDASGNTAAATAYAILNP